ncbi:hypothetical protein ABT160_21240 [Streptomyces sp. NPDC001941]|uniref:hypothetical protein n=1 Tax=Streptomyces sp. NPDC001941 TaxID=3154659 RepID=UPI0033347200
MPDPASGSVPQRTSPPAEARGSGLSEAGELGLYGMVSGVLAVGAGAALALLVPGVEARLAVWMVVTVLISVAAGLWWGFTPVTVRSRVLGRVLSPGEKRNP